MPVVPGSSATVINVREKNLSDRSEFPRSWILLFIIYWQTPSKHNANTLNTTQIIQIFSYEWAVKKQMNNKYVSEKKVGKWKWEIRSKLTFEPADKQNNFYFFLDGYKIGHELSGELQKITPEIPSLMQLCPVYYIRKREGPIVFPYEVPRKCRHHVFRRTHFHKYNSSIGPCRRRFRPRRAPIGHYQ